MDPTIALERFRETGTGTGAEPLVVTSIRLDSSEFTTDRGARELPAWALRFHDVDHEAKVLALTQDDFFPHPDGERGYAPLGVIGREDDLEVRVRFTAGPPDAETFDAMVIQDDTGVAFILRKLTDMRGPGPHITLGYAREIAVRLTEPIGQRVVLEGRTGAASALFQ